VINITQDAFPKEAYGVNGSLGALNAPSGPQDLYVRGKISNADGILRHHLRRWYCVSTSIWYNMDRYKW
jgi:hypothetical protein